MSKEKGQKEDYKTNNEIYELLSQHIKDNEVRWGKQTLINSALGVLVTGIITGIVKKFV